MDLFLDMGKNNSNPFTHATHNYQVCYKINDIEDCRDWVITTAFYSSMKFMEDNLFPKDYEHPRKHKIFENYKSFPEYIRAYGGLDGSNKHRIMSDLIENNITDYNVIDSYKDLKDACHTARYICYKVGDDRLKQSLEALEVIKNFCSN